MNSECHYQVVTFTFIFYSDIYNDLETRHETEITTYYG